MENLLPIGRFSKMTRRSGKALRRYDDLGLLVPAVVDPFSSYRYYTYSQANRAEAIRMLRRLEVPLEQIRELLAADDPEIVGKLLEMHRGDLEERLEKHRRMLAFIERLIERREGVMPYEVQIKEVPAEHVALVRRHTSFATIGTDVASGFAELGEATGRAGARVTGPPFIVMVEEIDEEAEGTSSWASARGGVRRRWKVRAGLAPGHDGRVTLHRGPYEEVAPRITPSRGGSRSTATTSPDRRARSI
jgi:DNA-binding transcriptional MerR regulator